jgi:hypothetical protein
LRLIEARHRSRFSASLRTGITKDSEGIEINPSTVNVKSGQIQP